jgi:hypothetical protein
MLNLDSNQSIAFIPTALFLIGIQVFLTVHIAVEVIVILCLVKEEFRFPLWDRSQLLLHLIDWSDFLLIVSGITAGHSIIVSLRVTRLFLIFKGLVILIRVIEMELLTLSFIDYSFKKSWGKEKCQLVYYERYFIILLVWIDIWEEFIENVISITSITDCLWVYWWLFRNK